MVVTREWAIGFLQKLPDECSLEDIQEALEIHHKVLVGRQQIADGQGIPHEKAKEKLTKWLK